MSEQEVQLVDLLKYMHAMCSVRGDEIQELLPKLANKALDAGYWSEAFRVFLYDGGASVDDMRITLNSHIYELGGQVYLDTEQTDLIETTFYLRKSLDPNEDLLCVVDYLVADLFPHSYQSGPMHLHLYDLAMEYYQWAYDYAEWMQGQEYADKMHEVKTSIAKLAHAWLDQHAFPNPFDRL